MTSRIAKQRTLAYYRVRLFHETEAATAAARKFLLKHNLHPATVNWKQEQLEEFVDVMQDAAPCFSKHLVFTFNPQRWAHTLKAVVDA